MKKSKGVTREGGKGRWEGGYARWVVMRKGIRREEMKRLVSCNRGMLQKIRNVHMLKSVFLTCEQGFYIGVDES